MLLSLSWLREFTPYEGTAESLGDKLTMLGLEVEDIRHPFAALQSILVGHVVECFAHPNSDHLHCCKVDINQGTLLDIVCGAPNVSAGQKVAVAPVGTQLPDGTVLKKAKLRGQPSCGMICSERELALSDEHNGILVLPADSPVGTRLTDTLQLDTEILDLSITPNRADCLSVLGLAREVAMACNLPLQIPELAPPPEHFGAALPVPVDIAVPELCPLYAGCVISDLQTSASPMHIRYRLQAVGIRAISNIVDVTNYIMFECGQPLHAFDLDKLTDKRILVRPARSGEKLVTLDGQERILQTQDLCICDAEKPVALAGVMGGLNSEITAETRNVFLESAVFRPGTIRKTSKRLGLSSEASYRFERGIDQKRSLWALERACRMLASCGGVVREGVNVAEAQPFVPVKISFRPERASTLLGIDLEQDFEEKTLLDLGCQINKQASVWTVEQPSWRPDLTREADLIEEIGRVHGLDKIPPLLPPVRRNLSSTLSQHSTFAFWLRLRHWGAGLGLHEAINYSFTGHKELDLLGLPVQGRVSIVNPLSAEQDVLKTTLAPGLLYDLRNNIAGGVQSVRLFELATVFSSAPEAETTVQEKGQLAILLYGTRHEVAWPHPVEDLQYADLKGLVEHLCAFLHLPPVQYVLDKEHPYLLPCVQVLLQDKNIGTLGRIKPNIAKEYLARKDVWLAELDLDVVQKLAEEAVVHFVPLPEYPPVRRDITVIAPSESKAGQFLTYLFSLKMPLLEDAVLVDMFTPDDAPEKHLTFRLTFRHRERTLKDPEVDREREKIATALIKQFGVRI